MYYFIVNPNSRSGKGADIWKSLSHSLDHRNIPYKAYLTECAGHATELSEKISSSAAQDHPITLIAVGGDGTIQEILTGLKNFSFLRFGYIPTGSGNDFCRSMKLPGKPEDALEAILYSEKTLPMDVSEITCNGFSSRFAVSCGIGFDAAVCHEISVSPIKKLLNHLGLGKLAYLFIGLKQLLFLPPISISIDTDADMKHTYDNVFLTAVMNQKYEGGGFCFCPCADPSDGLLDVLVLEGMGRLRLIFCLFLSIFGRHTCFRGVHLLRCQRITVKSSKSLAIHKDGESAGLGTGFSVQLTDKKLQVIIP